MNPSLQDQTVALLGNFYGGCRSVRQKQLITSSLFLSSPNYAFIFVFIFTFEFDKQNSSPGLLVSSSLADVQLAF